jgi:hypothetical protein
MQPFCVAYMSVLYSVRNNWFCWPRGSSNTWEVDKPFPLAWQHREGKTHTVHLLHDGLASLDLRIGG